MENKNINVLYIDDETDNLTSFRATFRRNFNISTAESADAAIPILENETIHVILSDQRMPKMTGIEFSKKLKLSILILSVF
jgi:response regulator RpfG family c-di-GMP phosphodiesterase